MEPSSSVAAFTSRPPARCRLLALAAAVVAGAATSGAQSPPLPSPPVLSLSDALREIAAHSSTAITAGLDLAAAREATARARAHFNPTVELSAAHLNRDHKVVAVFGPLQAPTTQVSFFEGELDASYLVWDGGRRSSALKASQQGEDATALRGLSDVHAAQLEGLAAYLRILTLKAQRGVITQREASLQDHLRVVKDLYEHGVVARNDLLETEVRLRLVQDQAAATDDGVAVGIQALNRLMGRDPGEPLALPASLPAPPPLHASLADLEKRAADANPQLRALRARLKAEEAVVALRRAEDYPTVIAQASHTYQQNQYLAYPNANILFLGLSWQAYDGGVRRAGVREAEDTAAKTAQAIAETQRQIEILLDQVYREYQQALREAGTARTNIVATEEDLRIEEDQYKSGLARTTDVLDAEAALADSRFALVNQDFAAYLKEGVLLTAAGEDLPSFFASLPPAESPAAPHPPAATSTADESVSPASGGRGSGARSPEPGPRSSTSEQ